MTLNPDECALLKQYAERGGTDSELMDILRLAYLNLRGRTRELLMTSILFERLHNYVRGTLNREGEALARKIFGRALDETLAQLN